jgi:hypothetical protein
MPATSIIGRTLPIAMLGAMGLLAAACARDVDIQKELQVVEVTTGWFDAGIVDGSKNKLVPTVAFKLRNESSTEISTVQINAVFRRAGEQEEWGSQFARAIGSDGLAAGASTNQIVLRSQLGYTGEQPRAEILQHSEFVDARVEIFAKHGPDQWVKLGDYDIRRQLLTR